VRAARRHSPKHIGYVDCRVGLDVAVHGCHVPGGFDRVPAVGLGWQRQYAVGRV
jgi:hypothetical protein